MDGHASFKSKPIVSLIAIAISPFIESNSVLVRFKGAGTVYHALYMLSSVQPDTRPQGVNINRPGEPDTGSAGAAVKGLVLNGSIKRYDFLHA